MASRGGLRLDQGGGEQCRSTHHQSLAHGTQVVKHGISPFRVLAGSRKRMLIALYGCPSMSTPCLVGELFMGTRQIAGEMRWFVSNL
jgi:hypothetical protein